MAENSQLTDALVLRQDFNQGSGGPTAARQFGIQRGKSGRQAG
jgi:hypothetical protein